MFSGTEVKIFPGSNYITFPTTDATLQGDDREDTSSTAKTSVDGVGILAREKIGDGIR